MSTTVSYKGATIATVSNDTKTLLTEGKYLEDDLTLTDVSGGGAVLTTKNISANGTYNASSDSADGYSQVNVAVPASAVDSGTKSITSNGTHDVVGYASASVAVPNSYSASDEGKVVSNGALVAQTAHADVTPTTSDQTIDTTTNNSIKVKGDADLVASNIKKDVEIFGVTGSYEGGGGGDPNENLLKLAKDTLTSVELDADGVKVKERLFNSAKGLLTAKLWNIGEDKVSPSGQYIFYNCTNLQTAVMSGQGTHVPVPSNTFNACSSLTKVDLTDLILYYGSAFINATSLNFLVIRNSSVAELGNINVFSNTPFASGGTGGTLYVPNDLIASYQAASNWSTILGYANNSIKSIESTHTDPTAPIDLTLYYADGTPISS